MEWQAASDNPGVLIVNMITVVTDIARAVIAFRYTMADGTAALVTEIHLDIIQVNSSAVCRILIFSNLEFEKRDDQVFFTRV